jgi:hypothetical protein
MFARVDKIKNDGPQGSETDPKMTNLIVLEVYSRSLYKRAHRGESLKTRCLHAQKQLLHGMYHALLR